MNSASVRRIANAGLLSLAVAALGACSEQSPISPNAGPPSLGSIPGGTGLPTNNAVAGETFKVCKIYRGADAGPVTVRVQVDELNDGAGPGDEDFNVQVAGGTCVAVWNTGGNGGTTDLVTVTETPIAGYLTAVRKETIEDAGPSILGPSVTSNTASNTITNPGGTGVDGVVVTFTNELVGGCTLTQGYWKTHSAAGPAPSDPDWITAFTPTGGTTPFFTSGMTWFQIFWTPPSGGNAYLQLAHQYMAAKLNILNGAPSTTAVNTAIAGAEAYFAGKPAGVITETNAATKTQIKGWASTLGQYNEGAIGPGHCDVTEPTA